MIAGDAERSCRRGVAALNAGDAEEAARWFERAITVDRQRGMKRPRPRFVSFYGLALALAGKSRREAVQACELALARDSFDPKLHLNLARVFLLFQRTTRALEVLERGLKLHPGNVALSNLLRRADRRQPPTFPSLSRDHLLNRSLGRMRATFRKPRTDKRWVAQHRLEGVEEVNSYSTSR